MNVEAENAVMRERARIREAVVNIQHYNFAESVAIPVLSGKIFIELGEVLAIISGASMAPLSVWDKPILPQLKDKKLGRKIEDTINEMNHESETTH